METLSILSLAFFRQNLDQTLMWTRPQQFRSHLIVDILFFHVLIQLQSTATVYVTGHVFGL